MKELNDQTDFKTLFGKVLKSRRDTLGLSLGEISEALGLAPSYYRAIEAGNFNLHSSNTRKLAAIMVWETMSVSLMLQILTDVSAARIAEKSAKKKEEAERLVRSEWLAMYPELTFLEYGAKSFDLMLAFLLVGVNGTNLDRKIAVFIRENPEFIDKLKIFIKTFS